MASSYVLLVNNERLLIDRELVLFTGSSRTKPKFVTKSSRQDVTEEVRSLLHEIMEQERQDQFYKYVLRDVPREGLANNELRIKTINTPLYELKCTLSESRQTSLCVVSRETQLPENITVKWSRERVSFFLDEVVKYADLMPVLESLINRSLKINKHNQAIVFKSNSQRMTHLFHIDVPCIRNPFTWFKDELKHTKLFAMAFDPDYQRVIGSFEDPQVFSALTNRDAVTVNVATGYDIFEMCNIPGNLALGFTSSSLVKLIGGLAANLLGATNENISVPTNGTAYVVLRDDYVSGLVPVDIGRTEAELEVEPDDQIVVWSLMYLFLLRAVGADMAGEVLNDFEKARLV